MKTQARTRIKNKIRNKMRSTTPKSASMPATASQSSYSTKTPKSLRSRCRSWTASHPDLSSHSGPRSSYPAPLPPASGACLCTRLRAGRTQRRTRASTSLRVRSSQVVPCYPVEMSHAPMVRGAKMTPTPVKKSQASHRITPRNSLTTATSCSG